MTAPRHLLVLLALACSVHSCSADDQPDLQLWQPHPSVIGTSGRNPKVACRLEGSGKKVGALIRSWYRRAGGGALEFLLSRQSPTRQSYGAGVGQRFLIEEDEGGNSFSLIIGNFAAADQGVYYCAVWFNHRYIFGPGTQVIYRDSPPALSRPSLSVYRPSARELREQGRATVLCRARGFSPPELRLRWRLDGEPVDAQAGAGGALSAWAVLTVRAESWRRGVRVSCRAEHLSADPADPPEKSVATERAVPPGCSRTADQQGDLGTEGNWTRGSGSADRSVYTAAAAAMRIAFACYAAACALSAAYGMAVCSVLLARSRARPPEKSSARGRGGAPGNLRERS
ncbi:immunoglobulin kappa light chain-like [Lepisosteus oculatus]|uniref:immunoglobulin kappa light chain-like n=1 Tax=Lepisosteus oculatus TaxID=7918 RepID=UPI003715EC21